MGLMDAKEYDPAPARRRLRIILLSLIPVVAALVLWFWPDGRFRYWGEWHVADNFFQAIERKDFDAAYGIYNADPAWKQHPEKYNLYPLPQFMLDWGPSGDYGVISSHEVGCALEPPKKGFASSSGVIVVVTINHRSQPTSIWVEKKSRTVSFSPRDAVCHAP